MSLYKHLADTTALLRKYSSTFVTTIALLGFSGCSSEQQAIAQQSERTPQIKRIPKDIEEEARILNNIYQKQFEAQKLRDSPNGKTRVSLEKQISLLTEAFSLRESIQPTYTKENSKEKWDFTKGILWARGNALSKLCNYKEAIADYDTHLQLNAEYYTGSVLNSRGNAKNEIGDVNGALTDYMLAAGADKEMDNPLYHRAKLLLQLGRFDEALRDINFALKRNPNNVEDLVLKSKILFQKGDSSSAHSVAVAALDLDEKNVEALKRAAIAVRVVKYDARMDQLTRSAIYWDCKEGAINLLNKVIELAPEDHEAYGYRALTFFEIGKFEKAKKDFEKANQLMKKTELNLPVVQSGTNFNVLEYAIWDPEKQNIILLGRNDPKYSSRTISYYDLLQTAWKHPDPRFSLDITTETQVKVNEFFSRKKMNAEERGRFEHIIGEPGKALLSILAAYLPDENGGVRLRLHHYSISKIFRELATTFNVESELETILAGNGTPEIHNRAFEKICGLPDFYTKAQAALAKSNITERENLSLLFEKSAEENMLKRKMFLGPIVMINTFDFVPKSRLRYENIPNDNQLARVLFEADYALKYITSFPLDIANHQTHLQWLDAHKGLGNLSNKWTRFWISPKHISIESSEDGNTLHFKDACLQIEAAVEDNQGGDIKSPITAAYARFLTERYNIYSQNFAELQELQEASKVLMLAKLLKNRGITLPPLPKQQSWKSPLEVRGMVVATANIGDYDYIDVSGGVDFSNIEKKVELYKTPTVPRPQDIVIMPNSRGNLDEIRTNINNIELTGHVYGNTQPLRKVFRPGEGLQKDVVRLERLVALSTENLEKIKQGVKLDQQALEQYIQEQHTAAEEWRIAAADLLLGTMSDARQVRDAGRSFIAIGNREALQEGWNLLDRTNAPLTKFVDRIGNYVDLSVASEAFSEQVFAKNMQEHMENRDFAEAAKEGTLFLANSAIDAFNSVMSDPEVNANASKWIRGVGGNIVRAYNFTTGAIDSLNEASSFVENTVNAQEVLDNIDNNAELQKVLSKQHKNNVDKLKKAREKLEKLGF